MPQEMAVAICTAATKTRRLWRKGWSWSRNGHGRRWQHGTNTSFVVVSCNNTNRNRRYAHKIITLPIQLPILPACWKQPLRSKDDFFRQELTTLIIPQLRGIFSMTSRYTCNDTQYSYFRLCNRRKLLGVGSGAEPKLLVARKSKSATSVKQDLLSICSWLPSPHHDGGRAKRPYWVFSKHTRASCKQALQGLASGAYTGQLAAASKQTRAPWSDEPFFALLELGSPR